MAEIIKLDIGCGRNPQRGFIGVDPYIEGMVNAPMWDLPYESGSVDEIYSSHALEHIRKGQVVQTLLEWARVIRPGGKITIRVPDLAWVCENWLKHRTNDWHMDAIFGNQEHDGEMHHTGFTKEIMERYLAEAGLVVTSFQDVWSHEQNTLHFEATRYPTYYAAVLSYNRPDLTQMMVTQLPAAIIIENGSALNKRYLSDDYEYIVWDDRLSFTEGWNRAMRELDIIDADYVWMLNSDVVNASPWMMATLVDRAMRTPDCAVISPSMNAPHPHMHPDRTGGSRPVNWIDWTAPLMSMWWWRRVGGFDTQFKGYGADIDISYRLRQIGGRMYVTDDISVYHLGSQTSATEGANGINSVEEMSRLLKEKYGKPWEALVR